MQGNCPKVQIRFSHGNNEEWELEELAGMGQTRLLNDYLRVQAIFLLTGSCLSENFVLFVLQEKCCQSLLFVICFEIIGNIPGLQSGLFPSLPFGKHPWKPGRKESVLFLSLPFSGHFLFALFCFSKCLPCVRTFTLYHFKKSWLLVNGNCVECINVLSHFILITIL